MAMNPFQYFPLYDQAHIEMYADGANLGDAPPHIFAVAESSFRTMMDEEDRQCISAFGSALCVSCAVVCHASSCVVASSLVFLSSHVMVVLTTRVPPNLSHLGRKWSGQDGSSQADHVVHRGREQFGWGRHGGG